MPQKNGGGPVSQTQTNWHDTPHARIMEILNWAASQGALHVQVGDIDILFPPEGAVCSTRPGVKPPDVGVSVDDPSDIRSTPLRPLDDPDYYASEVDSWAGYQPKPAP